MGLTIGRMEDYIAPVESLVLLMPLRKRILVPFQIDNLEQNS